MFRFRQGHLMKCLKASRGDCAGSDTSQLGYTYTITVSDYIDGQLHYRFKELRCPCGRYRPWYKAEDFERVFPS